MFTTTFTTPYLMRLNLPDDEVSTPPIINIKNTLSLILGKDNKIYWHQKEYNQLTISDLHEIEYADEVRKLIIEKRRNAKKKENFTVIIHPADESTYKNTVDILDEMAITNQERYVLGELNPKEKQIYESIKK